MIAASIEIEPEDLADFTRDWDITTHRVMNGDSQLSVIWKIQRKQQAEVTGDCIAAGVGS